MSKAVVNEPSSLLTAAENESVFSNLGNKRQSKATAVVQLFHAHPNPRSWSKVKTGAMCFVKDNPKKSYYFRLVDLSTGAVAFEQEMYDQLWYRRDLPHFHIFPGDKFMIGLNFADEGEAEKFYDAVNTKISEKKRRDTIKRNTQQQNGPASPTHTAQPSPTTTAAPQSNDNVFAGIGGLNTQQQSAGGKKKRKKITKADISGPSNFVHLAHVGWDPNTGSFDSSNISPEWKRLLDMVGVTENDLQDQDTAKFIHDFVEQNGGIEEANRQLEESNRVPAPPPPTRTSSRSAAPPPPAPNRGRGPPPAPARSGSGGGPPPPPPPPVPGVPGPPPPPSLANKPSGGPSKPSPAAQPPDNRSALLSSIRGVKKLNKVDSSDIKDRSEANVGASSGGNDAPKSGMAGALALALSRRQQFIQASDDESEEEEDDDDDWED
uniref:WASP/N-WASP n=1 Tax=Halisarca dujardinii TaxID=2583056 RepID=A0A9F1U416_HALDU|nr:WASP/N-WASP [Halisarca dujardinii]